MRNIRNQKQAEAAAVRSQAATVKKETWLIVLHETTFKMPFACSMEAFSYTADKGGVATACDIVINDMTNGVKADFVFSVNGKEVFSKAFSEAVQDHISIGDASFSEGDVLTVAVNVDGPCTLSEVSVVFSCREA
jgi:hypothetical protein